MKIRQTQLNFASRRRIAPLAFTLVELLIIVAIIGVLLASGVPAIRNMIYTSTGSLAESQLRFGLGAARDLAIRTSSGDTAAVFTFEPGGRLSIVPMVWVGQVLDTANPEVAFGSATTTVYRDVFVPTALAEPSQFPAGWMVRGFAPPYSIFGTNQRNNDNVVIPSNGWYFEQTAAGNRRINAPGVQGSTGNDQISGAQNKGNWVFPENGFFDPDKDQSSAVRANSRSTFMVRFQSGTGRIVGANSTPAIVLLPRTQINSVQFPQSLARLEGSTPWAGASDWRRVDRCDNLPAWARAVIKLPDAGDAAALIGCRSTDSALAVNVNVIALYDEARMASAIGAQGLNRVTGSIYGGAVTGAGSGSASAANEMPKAPNIDISLFAQSAPFSPATNPEAVQMLINNYMIGALRYSDVTTGGQNKRIASDARLFTFDTYLGTVLEAK